MHIVLKKARKNSFTTRYAGGAEYTEKRMFSPFVRLRINSGAKTRIKGLRARGYRPLVLCR
ncbi:MAG TPA: hypothetical protein PK514_15775 [Spirochaetota bacterium]|nr:hypothetical protein [Spirochaetota bacterium]